MCLSGPQPLPALMAQITWDMFLTPRPSVMVFQTFVLPKGVECPSWASCRESSEGISACKDRSRGGRQNRTARVVSRPHRCSTRAMGKALSYGAPLWNLIKSFFIANVQFAKPWKFGMNETHRSLPSGESTARDGQRSDTQMQVTYRLWWGKNREFSAY